MLQSAITISQSIPDYAAQLNTMSLLRGNFKFLFEWLNFVDLILDLYHVCNDPRLTETNDRVIQINDSLQKDYQSAVSLAEHRHLLTVRNEIYMYIHI
jgi:hypothetical protein